MYFKISVTCFCYYFNWIISILVFCWIWKYIADRMFLKHLTCFCFLVNFVAGCLELGKEIDHGLFQNMVSALGQTKLYHHPPTTSQNISTTTHHHPPPAKIYAPPPTTSQNISTNAHHDPPTAKTFFMRNQFIRISRHCLAATSYSPLKFIFLKKEANF